MLCRTVAGIHSARLVGSTHMSSPTLAMRMPDDAQVSWCSGCRCVWKRWRADIGNARTRMAGAGAAAPPAAASCPDPGIACQATPQPSAFPVLRLPAMPMNIYHRRYCASATWARQVEGALLPWALEGVDLGDDVLEVGPGYGATTRLLSGRVTRLRALEVDELLGGRMP